MKVYTVQREYDYDFSMVIGVFSTKKAAEECCKKDVDSKGRPRGDSYEVEEHDLQE